jgi:hypothetical protein
VKKRCISTLLFSTPSVVVTAAASMFTIKKMKSVNVELHIRIVHFRAVYYVHFSVFISFMSWNKEFDSNAFNVNTIHD